MKSIPVARLSLSALSCLVLLAWSPSSLADEIVPEVVVTATRAPVDRARVLADVSVITREDIDRSGAMDLADLLDRQPGLTFSNNGGPGTYTDVFVRGANARFTALLVDGLRVDSQNLQGGAVWQGIPLSQIDRIEVVRGAGSALYGSDAVGGVIQVFTRKPVDGVVSLAGGLTLGSHGTVKSDATVSGRQSGFDYGLTLGAERANGRSVINNPSSPDWRVDRDGYGQSSAQARLGWQLLAGHRLEALAGRHRTRADFDDRYASADQDSVATTVIRTSQVAWLADWVPGLKAQYRLGESSTEVLSESSGYLRAKTRTRTALAQHDWQRGPHGVQVLLENRVDRMSAAYDGSSSFEGPEPRRDQLGLGLGYAWDQDGWVFSARARQDDDSEFGVHHTGTVAGGWRFAPGWMARVSYSEGFRAPTLYERFAQYDGNPDLRAETSHGSEAAISWQRGADLASVTAYDQRINQLIEYSMSQFQYFNVGQARLKGLTFAAQTRWAGANWSGSWDLQEARNEQTGERLIRRPRYHGNLSADTDLMGWTVGARSRFVGGRSDIDGDSLTVHNGGYVTWGVFASRQLAPGWQLLTRVDNVFNKRYEVARDYAVPGAFAQVALRYQPR
ncbi:TonB-dependent receptor domain-containing protein [Aquabacterium parvum]|uniref:TonB-dependent receptor domain-containing protein n=1 Tax=Aquabacterium parvum TaxID=70584 RepID=UPI000AE12524|nr:TonB-dependent receptor [Aquabacterium parvum]